MTTFFSVDVETSGLSPDHDVLLTIGIKPVHYNPKTRTATLLPNDFYIRLDRESDLREIGWYDNPNRYMSSRTFWEEQADLPQDEAFRDRSLTRVTPQHAVQTLNRYVIDLEPKWERRIFVANPVSFDKMWIDHLFHTNNFEVPFHYRSLCLRSMKFGMQPPGTDYGSDRDSHRSRVPHHAFYDALAQAEDLVDMLNQRDSTKETQ